MNDEPVTAAQARERALYHAQRASAECQTRRGREEGAMLAEAHTSQAWTLIANALRLDELRADTETLSRELREQGLTATGRRVREPQPQTPSPAGSIKFPPGPDRRQWEFGQQVHEAVARNERANATEPGEST